MRTDAEKLSNKPIKVTMGGVEYDIHPQPLRQSRLWKQKARPVVEQFQGMFKVDLSDNEAAITALVTFIFDTLDELIDLVLDYDPSLPKEVLLDTATEEEALEAVMAVIHLAFPLVRLLGINPTNLASMIKTTPTA